MCSARTNSKDWISSDLMRRPKRRSTSRRSGGRATARGRRRRSARRWRRACATRLVANARGRERYGTPRSLERCECDAGRPVLAGLRAPTTASASAKVTAGRSPAAIFKNSPDSMTRRFQDAPRDRPRGRRCSPRCERRARPREERRCRGRGTARSRRSRPERCPRPRRTLGSAAVLPNATVRTEPLRPRRDHQRETNKRRSQAPCKGFARVHHAFGRLLNAPFPASDVVDRLHADRLDRLHERCVITLRLVTVGFRPLGDGRVGHVDAGRQALADPNPMDRWSPRRSR